MVCFSSSASPHFAQAITGDGTIYEKAREYAKDITELLLPETAEELFASYRSLLEQEAIASYGPEILPRTLEQGREISETVRLVADKQGRNVKQGELGKILRQLDEEVEPETICSR